MEVDIIESPGQAMENGDEHTALPVVANISQSPILHSLPFLAITP